MLAFAAAGVPPQALALRVLVASHIPEVGHGVVAEPVQADVQELLHGRVLFLSGT